MKNSKEANIERLAKFETFKFENQNLIFGGTKLGSISTEEDLE